MNEKVNTLKKEIHAPDDKVLDSSANKQLVTQTNSIQHHLLKNMKVVWAQDAKAYIVLANNNLCACAVGSRQANNLIRHYANSTGVSLKRNDLNELNDQLKAYAEVDGERQTVWYRVASETESLMIDVGDDQHRRISITPGNVSIITESCKTLFYRSPFMRPMILPADVGDITLLHKYLNMHPASIALFIGWLSYTLAHPKQVSTKFVILVLQGNQGTGKTSLCNNVIIKLIDPSTIGVQLLPNNSKDLAIASQISHVLCYDNLREFKQSIADILCIASTGGSVTSRQLYTDSDQQVLNLHAALVLNGIHSFVDQPDLAQRCLPIQLLPISENMRKSEDEINCEFEADLPFIMRGLLDLISNIMLHLPTIKVTHPERMIDFVKWLAAMEKVQGVPAGVYQDAYSYDLRQGQLDSLLDNIIASTLLEFINDLGTGNWSGKPADLLFQLNGFVKIGTQRSREWPQNPIALSKRLIPLQTALLSQGIKLEFTRGKTRNITISSLGAKHDTFNGEY